MTAKVRSKPAERTRETASIVVPLPSWLKIAAAIVALWGGLVTWQIQQGLEQLRVLTERVGTMDTRVAVLEERLPQPLGKELAPLTEQVRELALQVAELRGQLGGKPASANKLSD